MSTAIAPEQRAPRTKARLSDRARGERNLGWMLAAPAFLVMLAVTAWPILSATWQSLHRYRLTDPTNREFVGLKNYGVIVTDPVFWRAMGVTAAITIITVVVELILGFALAMLMHRIIIPRAMLRTISLIPYAIITVVSAFAWLYAFRVDTGFVNTWLNTLTFGGFPKDFDWFGQAWSALLVICASEIWKTTPFMALLLLAGLAQIDGAMEEAAKVDGAGFWQRLFKVVLPNMKGAVMVALLFRTLDAFRIFDNIYIMTKGAMGTSSLSLLAYNQTISRVEIGMGSALSVVLFLCVLAIALIFVKVFKVDLVNDR